MRHQDALAFIHEQAEHMTHMVMEFSAINSGSYHVEGLGRMAQALRDHFQWLNAEEEILDLQPLQKVGSDGELSAVPLGQALRWRKRPDAPVQIFLGGHYDTVFDRDHPFQTPEFLDTNTLRGPGVADLKGGLVVMLKALEALERSEEASQIGWEVLLNPDEEIGSPGSDPLLKEAAGRNHLGLIYEPSLPDGTLVCERKGSGNFTLVVRGKAAHAGREHHLGRNAIVRLADAITRIDGLNGQQAELTVNPGIIEGGSALNTVPDLAMLRFNIRVASMEQQYWVQEQLEHVLEALRKDYPHDEFALHGGFTRPPKRYSEQDRPLWEAVQRCGEMLNIPIQSRATGGCCDGNNMAAYGLSNIDTLGVRGAHIHSDQEYVLLDSLSERAKLSALLLLQLASGEITLPAT